MALTLAALAGTTTNLEPSWNVAPTQAAAVVRRNPEGNQRQIDMLRWGLVPSWTKDLKTARKPINARAETAAGSGMFRSAFASRRCLVPADLFYEWRSMPDGKQPYAIARVDSAPCVFGGFWEDWRGPDGEILRTYAIVTTAANAEMSTLHERMPLVLEAANAEMSTLHERMPLVLEAADWQAWLGEVETNPQELLRPAPDGTLHMWPVSRAVNSVRNNGPELVDRIGGPAAPPSSNASAGQNPA